MNSMDMDAVNAGFDKMFTSLLNDLTAGHPHPMDWRVLLFKPVWWRFAARRAYWRNVQLFAQHGFILTDGLAEKFERTEAQRFDEDAGGAMVRRLRQTFQYQTGVPFHTGEGS